MRDFGFVSIWNHNPSPVFYYWWNGRTLRNMNPACGYFKELRESSVLLSSQNKWRPSFRLAAVNTDKRRKRESPAHMIGGMWEPGVALGALSSVWVLSIRSIKSSHASKKTGQSKWVHQGWDMTQRTSFQIYSPFQWSVLWESICKIPWERKVKQRWRECVVGVSPEIRILCVPVHSRWPQSFIWMPDPLGLHIFSVFLP